MNEVSGTAFIHSIEEHTSFFEKFIEQAKHISQKLASMNPVEREIYLQQGICSYEFITILENTIAGGIIDSPNLIFLERLYFLPPRTALIFLLSYLYIEGLFFDNKETEVRIYQTLHSFFSYTNDTTALGAISLYHSQFCHELQTTLHKGMKQEASRYLKVFADSIIYILKNESQPLQEKSEQAIIDLLNFFHNEGCITQDELCAAVQHADIVLALSDILQRNSQSISEKISSNTVEKILQLTSTKQ